MQFHDFLSEKMSYKKKDKKRVTPGWTDISGYICIRSVIKILETRLTDL